MPNLNFHIYIYLQEGVTMKKLLLITALSSLTVSAFSAELKTDEQKLAYTVGTQLGTEIQPLNEMFPLDKEILFEAISDVLQNKKTQLSQKEMNTVAKSMQEKMVEKFKAKAKEEAEKNKAEGEKLLADNKAKDGVKVTKSGLQYRVITEGKGKKPTETDTVKVNYKGFLPDGKKFDDSAKAGGPVEFPLKVVIPGWTEGLQLMPVGSKYEFVIPAKLAYGEMAPPSIGPNRVLRFEVELVDIVKPETDTKKAESKEKTEKSTTETVKEAVKDTTEKTAEAVKEAVKKVAE